MGPFTSTVRLVLEDSVLNLDTEIGFLLAAPSFNIQAATSKECGKKKDKAGVEVDVGVGVEINAYEVAKAEFLGKERKAEAKQPIFSTTRPFYSTCVATPTARRVV